MGMLMSLLRPVRGQPSALALAAGAGMDNAPSSTPAPAPAPPAAARTIAEVVAAAGAAPPPSSEPDAGVGAGATVVPRALDLLVHLARKNSDAALALLSAPVRRPEDVGVADIAAPRHATTTPAPAPTPTPAPAGDAEALPAFAVLLSLVGSSEARSRPAVLEKSLHLLELMLTEATRRVTAQSMQREEAAYRAALEAAKAEDKKGDTGDEKGDGGDKKGDDKKEGAGDKKDGAGDEEGEAKGSGSAPTTALAAEAEAAVEATAEALRQMGPQILESVSDVVAIQGLSQQTYSRAIRVLFLLAEMDPAYQLTLVQALCAMLVKAQDDVVSGEGRAARHGQCSSVLNTQYTVTPSSVSSAAFGAAPSAVLLGRLPSRCALRRLPLS